MTGIIIRDESAYEQKQSIDIILTTPRGTSLFKPKGQLSNMGSKGHWVAKYDDFSFSDFCRLHELRLLLKEHLASRNFSTAAWHHVNEYNILKSSYDNYILVNKTLNGLTP